MLGEFNINASVVGQFVILLLSIGIHEAFHAFTADRLGDDTPRRLGRTTFNPIAHLDPVLSVLLPALLMFSGSGLLFGAGKPVPVQAGNMRHPQRDFALVALAGPASNLLLVLLFTATLVGCRHAGIVDLGTTSFDWLWFGITINLLLALFNLIPIPPLDGSRLLAYLLPRTLQPAFYGLDRFGFLILVVLLFSGGFQEIMNVTYSPAREWWLDLVVHWGSV